MKIFIAEGDNARGPYTVDEVRKLLRAGAVEPAALGCREGEAEWHPLAEILREQPPVSATAASSQVPQPRKAHVRPQANQPSKSPRGMMMFPAIVALLAIIGAFVWIRDGELRGEVFIVTGGGESIKLGLVPVSIYPLEELQGHIERRKREYDRDIAGINKALANAKAEYDETFKTSYTILSRKTPNEIAALEGESKKKLGRYLELLAQQENMNSGAFFLTGIPKEIYSARTDSNGRYELKLPRRGKFALVAVASRRVGQGLEAYYWVVNASLEGASQKNVPLSNHNLSTSGSAESLIKSAE